jgi:hypothetical protein
MPTYIFSHITLLKSLGIDIIEGKFVEAAETYREALR